MTNRNMNMNSDDTGMTETGAYENAAASAMPFFLKPAAKNYIWGGRRLNDDFSKGIDIYPLAETWECSTHPDGLSTVASGRFAGLTLGQVLRLHPEYRGSHTRGDEGLPILIKLIDAKEDLSVQVHPDDDYARIHENGSLGKTELWYVVDAAKDAQLVYGFTHDVSREQIRQSIADGSIGKYLQHVPVKKDDVFFIPPGQVHAIGAGVLVAEIQESSNVTYRLYDYDRKDADGNRRSLQVDRALEVADLRGSMQPRQPMRTLQFRAGQASELLCRCSYFQVERLLVNTERVRQMAEVTAGSNSCQVLLCTEGCGMMCWGDEKLPFYRGDCVFLPACCAPAHIHGKAQLLKVSC